jgi:hypothetical protein
MESTRETPPDLATERLAAEVADIEASVAMVASGAASHITLTGLRFGQQVAERLSASAARHGVHLEASFWPEDSVCDVHISRAVGADRG